METQPELSDIVDRALTDAAEQYLRYVVFEPQPEKGNIMSAAQLAISMTKKALNDYSASLDETLTFESLASLKSSLLGTEDFKEGVTAFAEKRAPKFTGK